jgi:hypothetical protein
MEFSPPLHPDREENRTVTYRVTFPFSDLDFARHFLAAREAEGWQGLILDANGDEITTTTAITLQLVPKDEIVPESKRV